MQLITINLKTNKVNHEIMCMRIKQTKKIIKNINIDAKWFLRAVIKNIFDERLINV